MRPKKTILICPLDWGLGHATRCVPIIRELQRLGHQVIIGADKYPLAFLKKEFPTLKTIVIPGYAISYDENGSFYKLFIEGVKFHQFIKEEHRLLDKIIDDFNIDLVISDNRYGLWNERVKTIIITHQLFVKAPIGELIAQKKIKGLIEQFNDCWIPDVEGSDNLSGELSHLKAITFPHRFIGPLSRFPSKQGVTLSGFDEGKDEERRKQDREVDVLCLISGPEPQRSIFEQMILDQLHQLDIYAIVLCGKPGRQEILEKGKVKCYAHLPTPELETLLIKSNLVVCRSGYSSIMDLMTLGKKAILVPTPGQTEQEYLAKYHLEKGNFYSQTQKEFNLKEALIAVKNFTPSFKQEQPLNLDFLL